MRIMMTRPGPAFSVMDVHNGWLHALRKIDGVQVIDQNFDDRLDYHQNGWREIVDSDACGSCGQKEFIPSLMRSEAVRAAWQSTLGDLYAQWPQVLIVTTAFFVDEWSFEVIRDRGTKIVVIATESPYEEQRQLEIAKHCDLMLLNDPTNLAAYEGVCEARYVGHSYDPRIHYPGAEPDEYQSDVFFAGTGFPSRVDFFERVDWSGIDLKLGGMWQQLDEASHLRSKVVHRLDHCMDNDVTARFYRGSKVGMNLYRREANPGDSAVGWACGPREIEMAACGLFFLRDPRPESDALFGDCLPVLEAEPEAVGEQVRYWLARPDERAERARAALEAVASRTFDERAKELLDLI